MTKSLQTLTLGVVFTLAFMALAAAQEKPAAPTPAKAPVVAIPLKIQLVISRYQGEKKVSSLPYSLSVTGGGSGVNVPPNFVGHANLRMGTKIPVTMMAPLTVDGRPASGVPTTGPIQYQDVGTNIDCNVWALDDGRFRLEITIEDSSVYPEEKEAAGATKGSPSFRSFRANDSMILKDGGTAQFTTATDKVSGEIVKVDVTLTVVK